MAGSDQKSGSFTVTDRRAFDASGEPNGTGSNSAQAAPKVQDTQSDAQRHIQPEPEGSLPPADFATLVLSLGSSAVGYLEELAAAADTKKSAANLLLAKHAIDLLSVLEEKTKGNLSSEEDQLLESLLFDLRLRYVDAVKTSTGAG